MSDTPIWIRVLYTTIVAWVGFIVFRDIAPALWRRSVGSATKRVATILMITVVAIFLAVALYCAVTGRITTITRPPL